MSAAKILCIANVEWSPSTQIQELQLQLQMAFLKPYFVGSSITKDHRV